MGKVEKRKEEEEEEKEKNKSLLWRAKCNSIREIEERANFVNFVSFLQLKNSEMEQYLFNCN